MPVSSGIAKTAALSLALVAHGLLALALTVPEVPQTEGGASSADVRLGNAFADMTAGGEMAAEAATESAVAETPRNIAPDAPRPSERQVAEAVPAQSDKAAVSAAAPDRLAMMAPQQARPVTSERAQAAAPSKPITAPKPERLTATPEDSPATTLSKRPKLRDPERAAAHKPTPKQKPEPKTKPQRVTASESGNSQSNARAGETAGRENASARKSGTAAPQQTAGNAAVSNYPGLVMKRLARAGKPRVRARGSAVIAFTVSAGGGLSAVSLARGSGSAALDNAAISLVKSAAPFPRPPQGARRNFSIQIKGQ